MTVVMPLPLELWLIHPDSDVCAAFERRFEGLPNVVVRQQRFEELPPHDCFVTAANSYGIMTAGIDAAVVRFHGEELMRRIQNRIQDAYLGEQPIGTALIEPTGNPDYPFVAHTPTMRTPGSIAGTDKVYLATWAALLAVYRHNTSRPERKIDTVAFPAMGTGFGAVSHDEAARQMAAAYYHYLHPPHRFDWDVVINREKRIGYDGDERRVR